MASSSTRSFFRRSLVQPNSQSGHFLALPISRRCLHSSRQCSVQAAHYIRAGSPARTTHWLAQRSGSQIWDSRRPFATSRPLNAALASHPPGQPTVLLAYPSPSEQAHDEAEEDVDEPDVDLVPPEDAKIEITDRAAEQLRAIAQRENNPDAALRIVVESGGCHGYQYKMELAKGRQPDDYHFAHPAIRPSNIYIDSVSLALLNGSTVDFATELIGSSFRVLDNPQSKGSGCGCGVSWELKI
ncbi:hypothetical protein OBBRIDRAFT_724799 [Obba rivulosa]|uniref:Core domain-containing protein n=1 Tax=Obba rivulosa TaxID=1052685 RepID=A0A8E2DPN4_9APHY|nr:hypothetical protein OBBRIDRAFT_724799 [Obba rivulosa]